MLFETKRLCDNRSSFFVTVATVLSDITPVLADGELIMKLHYHREDGAYDGWDAWLWPDGGEEVAMPLRMRAARWYLELYIFMWSPVWRATRRNMVRMQ